MSSGILHPVALVRPDLSENIADSILTQLWGTITLKMEATYSPKRRVQLEPHGIMSQKILAIATAVKTFQKVFFGPTFA
jgi:hypothetical protein